MRAVAGDNVLFDDCMDALRSYYNNDATRENFTTGTVLLIDFALNRVLDFGIFKVHPSKRVNLIYSRIAFICEFEITADNRKSYAHPLGNAAATIISFSTGRLCRSLRDEFIGPRSGYTDEQLNFIASIHPIRRSGNGSVTTELSDDKINNIEIEVKGIIDKLEKVSLNDYRAAMQSMRLIFLALLNVKEDFGLAYQLVISAIESIAQYAIPKEKSKKHPSESTWRARAKVDDEFRELFETYMKAKRPDDKIKERYIYFIRRFCPPESWENIIRHPLQDSADRLKNDSHSHDSYDVSKKWYELYPSDLSIDIIDNILSSSYIHRSIFVHRGEQPPHITLKGPTHFFQEVRNSDGEHIVVPNFEMMCDIARYSISAWLISCKNTNCLLSIKR